jgi:murein DD-endopeptidase MepM/ murein hydrolase activator NlpD
MSCVVELLRSRFWRCAATLALISIGLAACSGDLSRLNDPFTSRSPEAPGTLPEGQAGAVGGIDRQPLSLQKPIPLARAPKSSPVAAMRPAGNPGVHVVAQGETLTKISRLYGKPISEIAKANNIAATTQLNVGDRLSIPGVRVSPAKSKAAAPQVAQASQAKPAPVAAPKESQTGFVFAPVPESVPSEHSAEATKAAGGLPRLRWPAHGRVIAGFGPTTDGQQNSGINIALPENTPVKAAEDGVVEYAGSELRAYGNLVQIRHSNGYITVYAHAKELLVKRGDLVKRGQAIARSGQTGNVNSPQLQFQVRKGASPLDPMKFLNGA